MIPDVLNPFAADTLFDWIAVLVFYGAFFSVLGYRLLTARSIFIRRFQKPVGVEFDTVEVAERIQKLVSEYEDVHTRDLLSAAGARSGLGNPRLAAEGIGAAAARWYFLENSGVSLLYSMLNWVLPARELVGEVSVADSPRTIQARIQTEGAFKSGVLANGVAKLRGAGFEALEEAAVEVTYELLISAAQGMRIGRSESPGTQSWQALRALTEALEAWSRTPDLSDELAARVERKLDEALRYDPDYPLVHYNKGVFCYVERSGAAANREAREHFRRARDMARERLRIERSLVAGDADTRLLGLASIGLARACSQEVHRFGHLKYSGVGAREAAVANEETHWMEARAAAAEAVSNLPGDPQAVYAEGFAWHCTVSDGLTEDELAERGTHLDEGRKRYESLVSGRRFPGWRRRSNRLQVVHNNLGYVLMMGGELRANAGRRADARGSKREAARKRREAATWWKKAERHMRIAIEVATPSSYIKAYSLANLGNLQRLHAGNDPRLRGHFASAETSYDEAIRDWKRARGLHPSESGPVEYVDGLAERARLYVEMGDRVDQALEDHRSALEAAGSAQHRFKIARMFLIACDKKGLLGGRESVESAAEWMTEGGAPTPVDWIGRMRDVLSPPAPDPSGPDANGGVHFLDGF